MWFQSEIFTNRTNFKIYVTSDERVSYVPENAHAYALHASKHYLSLALKLAHKHTDASS